MTDEQKKKLAEKVEKEFQGDDKEKTEKERASKLDTEGLEEMKREDEEDLEGFASQIQKAIDMIWDEHDQDKSGFLDKIETKAFV